MTTSIYTVIGMTCEHCVNSVCTEVGNLAGVKRVEVDLDTGRVTVMSQGPLAAAQVAAAVEEAGYELATSGSGATR